ncbi:MAG TPA: ATP-binding protein [Gemmatimonadales bacterium]|nr:ATP-binding protein [Gemmatimonadales bacterium]
MKFAGRLVAGTVTVLFFTVAILVWTAGRTLRGNLEGELARTLENEARVLETTAAREDPVAGTALRRFEERSGHAVVVLDSTGRVALATDSLRGRPGEDQSDLPEVREARERGTGRATRRADPVSPTEMHVAVATGGRIVRVAAPTASVEAAVAEARRAMLGAALLALLLGSALAFVAGRSIAHPLTQIGAAARSIAQGAVPRFPRSGIPDIDTLIQALRQMHRQLEDRFAALRAEQATSSALVEAMVEGVIAADRRGRVTTANGAARRLLGYDETQPLPELPTLFRAKAAREVVEAALAGAPVQDRQLDFDGRTLLVNARPLGEDGTVLVLHDLTELRRLENVRRDFVANVSHELKTPLTVIKGYAETLLADAPDPATSQRFLSIIQSNARRMQRLVDDLLDLSRIEAGRWQPHPEPVDVTGAARDVFATLAERAAAREVKLLVQVAPDAQTVHADPDALRQILTNLVDNSIRYTPRGGCVSCTARAVEDGVEVAVADEGAGIASEHLPRIFERFYRVDSSRSREEGGTGLGLAIVKHLTEAHGGRVAAESVLGHGTTVRCWFPEAEPG